MEKQLPDGLLTKYLNGQCNMQEEAIVKEWYNSFANDDDHISSMNDVQSADLKMHMREAIAHNIAEAEQPVHTSNTKLSYLLYSMAGIAAVLLLTVKLLFNHQSYKQPAVMAKPAEVLSVSNQTKTIHEQILSDGSHVWLYPGASIRYTRKFSGPTREISMSGETFFDVSKDAAHPFIIHSKHMTTKVWGTSFRVRDGEDAAYADVTVVTGKVSVKPVGDESRVKEVMLHPNEQISWFKKHDVLKTYHDVTNKDLTIWKKVNLTFDNTPINEVLPVLNKQFNVNITSTDDSVNNYILDADFNGLNFASVMEILKKTLNISYEINGTNIILKNNNQ